ncbi:MAG: membrane protein insertion efficiency factor YidD [Acidimicrobiales bacterium]|nr:membrane protein insertion efficiency factor YidD [Acidimicrobiales bacterium]
MSLPGRALTWLITWYQKARHGRLSPCRFEPSCSTYALQSIELHGAMRGGWLGLKRVCRCNPWGGKGWDPVPEPKHSHKSLAQSPTEGKVA